MARAFRVLGWFVIGVGLGLLTFAVFFLDSPWGQPWTAARAALAQAEGAAE